MKLTTLESVLTSQVFTLPLGTTISTAISTMTSKSLSCIVITDSENHPIGIVTEHDTLKFISNKLPESTPIEDLMRSITFTAHKNDEVHDAYIKMTEKSDKFLIVSDDDGKLFGIVTQGDFLRHIGHRNLVGGKTITDVMSKSIMIIKKDASLRQVAIDMQSRDCEFAIIVEHNTPIGLITERDILNHATDNDTMGSDSIDGIYQTDFPIISEQTPLIDASTLMEWHGVHQLVVTDRYKNLVGLLTRHDVLQAVHNSYFEFLMHQVERKSSALQQILEENEHLSTYANELKRSEENFRMLFDMLPDGVLLIDPESLLAVDFNTVACTQLGYSFEEFSNIHVGQYEIGDKGIHNHEKLALILKHGYDNFEVRHRTKHGQEMDVFVKVSIVAINGKNLMLTHYQDITEQKLYEQSLQEHQDDLNQAQAIAHIGSWKLDFKNGILKWSDECYNIFGVPQGTPLTYQMFLKCIHPDDTMLVDQAWKSALKGDPYEIEHRVIANGTIKWIKERARLEFDENKNAIRGVGTAQDVTERKEYEKKLEFMANYDLLTGLANRALLQSHLRHLTDKSKRHGTKIALLMLDLDRFKDVNDSFGHTAGDDLLKQVAHRLNERLRNEDIVCRLGGDEFAVVIENPHRIEDAARISGELIETLGMVYYLEHNIEVHVSASIGIAVYPDHGTSVEELIQHADAAMYRAKSEGRNAYTYYTDELTNFARNRITLESKLRLAIENNELEVYYQPQVHIMTGKIMGAEALVRWRHPVEGMISPAQFIPLAEETGLIGKIGAWVLRQTCLQGKKWHDAGHRLTLAVNLSAHQMKHQDIAALVQDTLVDTQYPPNKLELELTESALMLREDEAVTILHSLRALGIRLAIDDFGTGYSSLAYLKRFPLDVLKIDKKFVDDVPFEKDGVAIVKAIIAMGKALGFELLAEGVEKPEQLEFLKDYGCEMFQGYLKSPPIPAEKFEKLLREN